MYLCRAGRYPGRTKITGPGSEKSAGEAAHHGVLQSDGQHGAHYQQRPEDIRHVRDRPEEINLKRIVKKNPE